MNITYRKQTIYRHTEKQLQDIATRYANGATMDEIAAIYHVCRETIKLRLVQMGVTIRPKIKVRPKQKIFEVQKKLIISLFEQGMNCYQISKQMQLGPFTISKCLANCGVRAIKTQERLPIKLRSKKYRDKQLKDPMFKLAQSIRHGINKSLLTAFRKKDRRHWETLVGYTLEDLKQHLEKQFEPGMTWENHSYRGWHIDHIRPVISFNITGAECEDFKKCWALDNLRPLWGVDNMRKNDTWNAPISLRD